MQKLDEAIKTVHGPTHHSTHPVSFTGGKTLMKDRHGILNRWAEHLSGLLNRVNSTDSSFLDSIPQLPPIPDLDLSPSFHEVEDIYLFYLLNVD